MDLTVLTPHEVAFMAAVSRMAKTSIPALIEDRGNNLGAMYLIGPVTLPPLIITPNRSPRDETPWYDAFRQLWRERRFLEHEKGNVYRISGVGWQFVERLRGSKLKGADGSLVWDKIQNCLDDMGKAQIQHLDDEVVKLTTELLALCEKLAEK